MKVPFVDLQIQYQSLKEEILPEVEKVFSQCNFILGEPVAEFEKEYAEFSHAKYAIGVASGTDALHLACRALDIGPGDEVLVPANTFIATALGVSYAGATPVPVDMDPKTFLIDPTLIEKAITPKTKAIMPVHLYGRMNDMKPIMDIAQKHGLKVIEDAAQSQGASLKGQTAGSVGDIGCFSFYPGKNLGAYGDAGGLTTNSKELYEKLVALRNYGSPKKYHHPVLGFNSRLDTVQAVVLRAKLKKLQSYNDNRYKAALKYQEALRDLSEVTLPEVPEAGSHIFHLFVCRTERRDEMVDFLNSEGVGCVIHYPVPFHLQGAYKDLGYKEGDFPETEKASKEIFSLPMFPELTDEQIAHVASKVKEFFKK